MDRIVPRTLVFGRFALDLRRGLLRAGDQDIELRPKAFEVLCYLVENAGRLVALDELHKAVWGDVAVTDDSIVQKNAFGLLVRSPDAGAERADPVRGQGDALCAPITYTSAKQLVPVANKPVLFYGIEAMAKAGIEEIGIIIAPETGDEIRETAGDGSLFGVRITYIPQAQPLGLAHAVLTAEPFLGDSPFVMYLGDNLLQGGIEDLVTAFRTSSPDALILLTPVPDRVLRRGRAVRRRRGAAGGEAEGTEIGSGPGRRVHVHAGIHDAARAICPSGRGELEITDASSTSSIPAGGSSRTSSRGGGRTRDGWRTCWPPTGSCSTRSSGRSRASCRLADRRARGRGTRGPAGAMHRARPGDHRVRRAADRLLHRAVHGDRLRLRHHRRRGRALDPADRVERRGPGRSARVIAARSQRENLPRRPAAAGLPLSRRGQLRDLDPVSGGVRAASRPKKVAIGLALKFAIGAYPSDSYNRWAPGWPSVRCRAAPSCSRAGGRCPGARAAGAGPGRARGRPGSHTSA